MSEHYNENRVTYVTPVKQMNQSQYGGPAARPSTFVQPEARFYKEIYRDQKNIAQMRHSTTYDIIKHDQAEPAAASADKNQCGENFSPLKASDKANYNTAGKDVFSQSMSPCKKRLQGQGSRMLETNFQMYPDSKDRAEALNPQVKRTRGNQCQFTQSEARDVINQSPEKQRPQTAVTQMAAVKSNVYSTKKVISEVQQHALLGQTKIAHPERKGKFTPMSRDERLKAVAGIHCSSQMTNIINQALDKDVTTRLAHAKQTNFSTYKGSMGYPVQPTAQKAPPVWKNF